MACGAPRRIVPSGTAMTATYNRAFRIPMATVLNSGLQNKDKAAKAVAPAKATVPTAPERTPAARREIRTVLVAAHGWPTDALLTARRTSRR